jgi:hypothetical protein
MILGLIHALVSIALTMTSGVVHTTNVGRHAVRTGRRSYTDGLANGRRLYRGAHSFAIAPGQNHRVQHIIETLRNERAALATA